MILNIKNFACFILFSYQCSFAALMSCTHQRLFYIITCCFICQQLFSTFFDLFSLFQRRPLKHPAFSVVLLLPCSATSDNIHPLGDKSQQHFTKFFQTGRINKIHNFRLGICGFCTITIYLIIRSQLLLG